MNTMYHKVADSSLSQSEKEEREVGRLIDKDRAPSRKTSPQRGPKYDNRRTRMKVEDQDLNISDKDMSLNWKDVGSLLNNIALKININSTTSNDELDFRNMNQKTAQYHGVLIQGHPSGPTNTVPQIDKRFFNEDNYESIISSAKDYMKSGWLSDWEGGAEDAPYRAALDLAISTADNGLYQSKIDSNLYSFLLSDLMGIKINLFDETFLSEKTKKASTMVSSKEIVRVANDIQSIDPVLSIRLLKMASQVETGLDNKFFSQAEQNASGEPMNKKEILDQVHLLEDAKDADDLSEALKKIEEGLKLSFSRIAGSSKVDAIINAIQDLDEDQIEALVNSMKADVKALEDHIQRAFGKEKEEVSSISEEDIDGLLSQFDNIITEVQKETDHVKTSSVRININTLVKVATLLKKEDVSILDSVLRVAAKKVKKNKVSQKDKKTAPEKKDEKKNPFSNKKEEPAKGKKTVKNEKVKEDQKKPKKDVAGRKKKASVDFSDDDMNW